MSPALTAMPWCAGWTRSGRKRDYQAATKFDSFEGAREYLVDELHMLANPELRLGATDRTADEDEVMQAIDTWLERPEQPNKVSLDGWDYWIAETPPPRTATTKHPTNNRGPRRAAPARPRHQESSNG